jgi:hypothetical protein
MGSYIAKRQNLVQKPVPSFTVALHKRFRMQLDPTAHSEHLLFLPEMLG